MMTFAGEQSYAVYDNFRVGDSTTKYNLTSIGQYSGNAGNSFWLPCRDENIVLGL